MRPPAGMEDFVFHLQNSDIGGLGIGYFYTNLE
jgi:hypothetical protein